MLILQNRGERPEHKETCYQSDKLSRATKFHFISLDKQRIFFQCVIFSNIMYLSYYIFPPISILLIIYFVLRYNSVIGISSFYDFLVLLSHMVSPQNCHLASSFYNLFIWKY